jgi:hypothetical protein
MRIVHWNWFTFFRFVHLPHLVDERPGYWMNDWLIFMGWYYISELLPLTDMLFTWRWYELESDGGMILTGKSRITRKKPVPLPLCPLQVPHGLTRAPTRASAVRGRRLTAWAMARSVHKWMINWKWFGRSWSWPNFKVLFRHSPGETGGKHEKNQSG